MIVTTQPSQKLKWRQPVCSYLDSPSVLPFLKMGTIFALFQSPLKLSWPFKGAREQPCPSSTSGIFPTVTRGCLSGLNVPELSPFLPQILFHTHMQLSGLRTTEIKDRYLSLFHVLCHKISCSTKHRVCILLSFLFTTGVLTETVSCCPLLLLLISALAALCLSWLYSYALEQCLFIPPKQPVPVSTFCVLTAFELRQELHVHPRWPSAMLAQIWTLCTVLVFWGGCPWRSASYPEAFCPAEQFPMKAALNRPKFALQKSREGTLLFILLTSLTIFNSIVSVPAAKGTLSLHIFNQFFHGFE